MFRVGVGWDEVLRMKGKYFGGIQIHNLSPGPQKHRYPRIYNLLFMFLLILKLRTNRAEYCLELFHEYKGFPRRNIAGNLFFCATYNILNPSNHFSEEGTRIRRIKYTIDETLRDRC
jgi:hypothetical protein